MKLVGTCNRKRGFSYQLAESPLVLDALCSLSFPLSFLDYLPSTLSLASTYADHSKYARILPPYQHKADSFETAFGWLVERFRYLEVSGPITLGETIEYLDLSTSPSWPWTLRFKSKEEALEHPYVWKYLDTFWHSECSLPCFFSVNPKEEILPKSKVMSKIARSTVGSPLEHNVSLTRLSKRLNHQIYQSGDEILAGSTEFYGGKDEWVRRMRFPNNFSGDLDSQDGSSTPLLLSVPVRFRKHFSEISVHTHLENLYVSMIRSFNVMPDGKIFSKTTGNNSGQSNTLVDNCLMLLFSVYYVFVRCLCVCNFPVDLAFFNEHVVCLVYGDNLNISVSDSVVEYFNPRTISYYLFELRYSITWQSNFSLEAHQLEFISAHCRNIFGCWVAVRPAHRAVAAALYRQREGEGLYGTLFRLAGLRIAYWSNPEARFWLEGIKNYICDRYSVDLTEFLPLFENNVWLSDARMLFLLCEYEIA